MYRGRFAPSPTGPLHFGSLVAALGSCLEARSQGGEWLLRMEDVDAPRCSMAAADQILFTLEAYGFCWDGELIWQKSRTDSYEAALADLKNKGLVFACACTRSELAEAPLGSDGSIVYPGRCRQGLPQGKNGRAWRLRVNRVEISFSDQFQGRQSAQLAVDAGDFVVFRADGFFAYQLAVVVDDAASGITHVVRGADLLHSTPRQIYLQRCLSLPTPSYAHLPVVINAAGEKLSKQTHAPALPENEKVAQLISALSVLGHPPPEPGNVVSLNEFWEWAITHWNSAAVPRKTVVQAPSSITPNPMDRV